MVLGCAADGKIEDYSFNLSELLAKAEEFPIAGSAKCVRSACTSTGFSPVPSRPAPSRQGFRRDPSRCWGWRGGFGGDLVEPHGLRAEQPLGHCEPKVG